MKRGSVALMGLVMVTVLFWYADFHAARSEVRSEHQVSTFTASPPESKGQAHSGRITVHLYGDPDLGQRTSGVLAEKLRAMPSVDSVTLVDQLPQGTTEPLLLVELPYSGLSWTPVRGSSRLTVKAVYSSNGDVSWRDEQTVRMETRGEPVVWAKGEIAVTDTTWGLVSRPGYEGLMGQAVASAVASAMEKPIATGNGTR